MTLILDHTVLVKRT